MHSCLRATACSALVPGRPSGGVPRRVKHSPPGHTHSLSAAVWSGGRKVGARPILPGHGKVPLLPSVAPSERIPPAWLFAFCRLGAGAPEEPARDSAAGLTTTFLNQLGKKAGREIVW